MSKMTVKALEIIFIAKFLYSVDRTHALFIVQEKKAILKTKLTVFEQRTIQESAVFENTTDPERSLPKPWA